LLRSDISKKDVAVEIPRKPVVAESRRLESPLTAVAESRPPLVGPLDPHRVIIGIVVDAKPRYLAQARLWLSSLQSLALWSGSEQPSPTVLACVLPGVPQSFKARFADAGVVIREILPLSEMLPGATPHSNKLRLLQQPECSRPGSRFDVCVYMDTDTLFLNGDLFAFLRPDPVVQFRAGRTLWADTVVADSAWHRVFELAGVMRMYPGRDALPLAERWPNTGVLVFPTKLVPQIFDRWLHYTDKCLGWLTAMKQDLYFTETVSFLLAMLTVLPRDDGVGDGSTTQPPSYLHYEMLPVQANTQLNLPLLDFKRNGYLSSLARVGPTVLHYPLDTLPSLGFGFDHDSMRHFEFLRGVNRRLALLAEKNVLHENLTAGTARPRGLVVQLVDASTPLHASASMCRSFRASSDESQDPARLLVRVRAEAGNRRLRWIDDEGDLIELAEAEDLEDARVVMASAGPGWSMVPSNCTPEDSDTAEESVGSRHRGGEKGDVLVLLMN
jgi:hypothetical protein